MNIQEIGNHIAFLIPIIGFCILVAIGGGLWALNQIRSELKKEFVQKEYCNKCVQDIKDGFHRDIDKKYDRLEQQIKFNREERQKEIKSISDNVIEIKAIMTYFMEGVMKK